VFIGVDMDKDEIYQNLNSCLISDDDFKKGQEFWNTLENPFLPDLSDEFEKEEVLKKQID
jgi:hypothetical protein